VMSVGSDGFFGGSGSSAEVSVGQGSVAMADDRGRFTPKTTSGLANGCGPLLGTTGIVVFLFTQEVQIDPILYPPRKAANSTRVGLSWPVFEVHAATGVGD